MKTKTNRALLLALLARKLRGEFFGGDAALRFATSDTHCHPCSTLYPGTSAQTALLYWVASSYEIEHRKVTLRAPRGVGA